MRFNRLFLIILPFFLNCRGQSAQEFPNLVLIVADDLGWRDLHCYGNNLAETPRLDKLASQGVKFNQAYASCNVCSPTRASLLTGKNPVAVDITDYIPGKQHKRGPRSSEKFIVPSFNHELPLDEVTLAERLNEKGYVTASIGKWHLGGEGYWPTNQGFDINIAGAERGMPPSYHYPYRADRFNFDLKNLKLGMDSLYLTDRLGNEAAEFINTYADSSFFLYLPFYTVHTPWEGRSDLVKKYEKKIGTNNDSIVRDPQFLAMIESLDQNIGKVLDAITSNQLDEKTLIIFTSDNGGLNVEKNNQVFGSYNKPLRGGKATHYEGGLRVPTIIRWTGMIPSGWESDEMIISTDFYPTVLEAFDVSLNKAVEGVSLWSHLTKQIPVNREVLYWHYPHYHRTTPGSVIRDHDYKLIHYYEDNHLELYNLAEDLSEIHDLSQDMPERTQELFRKLQQWLQENKAKMPTPNPDYLGEN